MQMIMPSQVAKEIQETVIATDKNVTITNGVEVILQPIIEEDSRKSLFGYRVVKAPAPVWAFILDKEDVTTETDVVADMARKGGRVVIESHPVRLNIKLKNGKILFRD